VHKLQVLNVLVVTARCCYGNASTSNWSIISASISSKSRINTDSLQQQATVSVALCNLIPPLCGTNSGAKINYREN